MFSIEDIISTLNGIEVKGKDNLDKLLGCIMALEAILEADSKEKNADEDKKGEVTEANG